MILNIKQYDVWLADLNPGFRTEPRKTRPVAIVQTNLLNEANHPSTIICPLTTNLIPESTILRVHLSAKEAGTKKPSDILVDQVRTIDNRRLIEKLGALDKNSAKNLKENLRVLFNL
jgi:mRNA interferase MazF